jgi:hypothetical protein
MTTPVPVLKIPIYDRIKTAIYLEVQGIPATVKTPEQLTPAQVVALGATAGIGTIGRIVDDTIEITLVAEPTIKWSEVGGWTAEWTAPKSAFPEANRLEDLRCQATVEVPPPSRPAAKRRFIISFALFCNSRPKFTTELWDTTGGLPTIKEIESIITVMCQVYAGVTRREVALLSVTEISPEGDV